jgi:hypothetical protein
MDPNIITPDKRYIPYLSSTGTLKYTIIENEVVHVGDSLLGCDAVWSGRFATYLPDNMA